MKSLSRTFNVLAELGHLARMLLTDGMHFLSLCARSRTALAAENLFLRKQLAFYQERQVRPRRFDNVTRCILVLLSYGFAWKEALVNVTPKTFIGWHRAGFRLFWRWKSRPGRPRIPPKLRTLIRAMARDNPGWGEERIANELLLKLGIRLSPRTVGKYIPHYPGRQPRGDQRWSTFVANHAKVIVACDFLTVVTATFKCLYVLVIIELGTRKLLHIHVTDHPTAAWTQQQLREAIPSDHDYRFLIHDRDATFSRQLDHSISQMGLRVLRTPYRSPKGNSFCERVIGTLRRECLDYLIPLTENHLCRLLKTWLTHYNQGRPHSSIGPGIPDPPAGLPVTPQEHRHRIPGHLKVVSHPVLGGLHHEYGLETKAA
ncbi:MAG: integrase core domain-containing protein [Nitrospirota bacterium]|nr:integrase core domain-containing protein [Nitrospirota bacterium]